MNLMMLFFRVLCQFVDQKGQLIQQTKNKNMFNMNMFYHLLQLSCDVVQTKVGGERRPPMMPCWHSDGASRWGSGAAAAAARPAAAPSSSTTHTVTAASTSTSAAAAAPCWLLPAAAPCWRLLTDLKEDEDTEDAEWNKTLWEETSLWG